MNYKNAKRKKMYHNGQGRPEWLRQKKLNEVKASRLRPVPKSKIYNLAMKLKHITYYHERILRYADHPRVGKNPSILKQLGNRLDQLEESHYRTTKNLKAENAKRKAA